MANTYYFKDYLNQLKTKKDLNNDFGLIEIDKEFSYYTDNENFPDLIIKELILENFIKFSDWYCWFNNTYNKDPSSSEVRMFIKITESIKKIKEKKENDFNRKAGNCSNKKILYSS